MKSVRSIINKINWIVLPTELDVVSDSIMDLVGEYVLDRTEVSMLDEVIDKLRRDIPKDNFWQD